MYIQLTQNLFDNNELNFDYQEYINSFITTYECPTFDNLDIYESNKILNNFIGFSCLIACLEKNEIVYKCENKVNEIINYYNINNDNDIKYKFVQSIHMIFKTLYNDNPLPDKYLTLVKNLLENDTSPKTKFKIFDIIDRK